MSRRSRRVERLPSYAIHELAVIKHRLVAEGVDVIDLSAGDADIPVPAEAIEALRAALDDPAMSRYPFQVGLAEFRQSAASYMQRRFGVTFDPATELIPLLGSKEGLAHLGLALLDPGDLCVVPDPGYPAYIGGALLADAEPELVPLVRDKGFLVELEELPAERLDRTGLVYLNYPNNPTTAVAPLDYLARTVELCRRHDIVLAYDNPYCEITYDGYRAPSIFEVEGAREVAIEFHSLSKTFSMTGWRIAWAVGNAELIGALHKVKTYADSGVFLAVQRAGAAVLDRAETLAPQLVAQFSERRDAAVRTLEQVGLPVEPPRGTMYLWVPLPEGVATQQFAREALERDGVMFMPGTAFGAGGEGYFRIALTVDSDRLTEAIHRVARTLERLGAARA